MPKRLPTPPILDPKPTVPSTPTAAALAAAQAPSQEAAAPETPVLTVFMEAPGDLRSALTELLASAPQDIATCTSVTPASMARYLAARAKAQEILERL